MIFKNEFFKWLIVVITSAIVGVVVVHFFLKGAKTNMFLFSWSLNFMLMLWTSMVVSLIKPSFSSPYFNSHAFENNGRIYEKLGINLYRKLLVIIGWEKVIRKANPISTNLDTIVKYEAAMRSSEFAHIIIFLVVLCVTVFVGVNYTFAHTIWLIVLNILFNLYPVMLQRYNRPRLRKVISRFRGSHLNGVLSVS